MIHFRRSYLVILEIKELEVKKHAGRLDMIGFSQDCGPLPVLEYSRHTTFGGTKMGPRPRTLGPKA